MSETVNHPQHYHAGSVETIDAIEGWGFGEGFNRGNVIKYVSRAGHKGTETELDDLMKARWYLDREISRLTKDSPIKETVKVVLDKGAIVPTRAHETDAGLDLYARNDGIVRAYQSHTFDTGVHVELPKGTVGLLLPKSGMMVKHNLLTFGVVDEGYTGSIKVHVFNHEANDYSVRMGDKISQLLIVPVHYNLVEVVEAITGGDRGDHGFGSTGK